MLRIKSLNLVTTGASLMPDKTSPSYTGAVCNDDYFITELRRITNLDAKRHVLPEHNKQFRIARALAKKVITAEENE